VDAEKISNFGYREICTKPSQDKQKNPFPSFPMLPVIELKEAVFPLLDCSSKFWEGIKFDLKHKLCYNYNRKKEEERRKRKIATLNVMPDNSKVNHPSHYSGSIEAIDAIAAATAELEGVEAFDTGNALKYLWRWKRKNGVEDLNKAVWYIQHLIKHLEETTKPQAIETQPSLRDYMTGAGYHNSQKL
jgi:hypothetical protein